MAKVHNMVWSLDAPHERSLVKGIRGFYVVLMGPRDVSAWNLVSRSPRFSQVVSCDYLVAKDGGSRASALVLECASRQQAEYLATSINAVRENGGVTERMATRLQLVASC